MDESQQSQHENPAPTIAPEPKTPDQDQSIQPDQTTQKSTAEPAVEIPETPLAPPEPAPEESSIESSQTLESSKSPIHQTLESSQSPIQEKKPPRSAIVDPDGFSAPTEPANELPPQTQPPAETTTQPRQPTPPQQSQSPEPAVEESESRVRENPVPRALNEAEQQALFLAGLKRLGARAVEAKRTRLQKNLDAIITRLKATGFITNDDVQRLCGVADSTATKYLKELERRGLIVPIGRKGRGMRWRLTQGI